jgi:diadenosine tetraphosphate (Ap4A) HIT family hydrolase
MEDTITIEANQSGRMWSNDPDAWERLSREESCPICARIAAGDPTNVVAATPAVLVTAQPDATLPGYVCVTSLRHAVEPYELDRAEQADFFLDAMAVAKALAGASNAVKMNYEIHGNTIPHLHIHLFPRRPDDPYVGYMITNRVWFKRTAAELEAIGECIRGELTERGRLTSWP